MIWKRLVSCRMLAFFFTAAHAAKAIAGVGDPQVATDHPWYPGELACSTFSRLLETQAELYERVVGVRPANDQDRVLAAWLWRNTHYWHGEPGAEDLWGQGFSNDSDSTTRDYWTGLFAHGFGLCGTTHAQWTAEMEQLLGHNRSRVVGVTGHNSFEVFLTGGPYGAGRWALLDHDVSTVIFDDQGQRLLSIAEIKEDVQRWTKMQTSAAKQQGWLACGLHPDDGAAFDSYRTAEYLAGYAGPPPVVHLRRGESLRRYVEPGLDDGRTFVFWGRSYNTSGIPGPERSRTWVNQPERMYGSKTGAGHRDGQARYANAVYTYQPDFANGDYREGIVDQSDQHVTFEFQSPYIIAATPPSDEAWAIYERGCRNGLVITGKAEVGISISTDRGRTWHEAGLLNGRHDLTDHAKGCRQYWLRFAADAKSLAGSQLEIITVCQANSSIIPRLTDNGSQVEFQSSGHALVSAGPNIAQAEAHRIDGQFDSPRVTLELAAPRGAPAVAVYAAAHVASSNPPSPKVAYQVEYSTDRGATWQPLVRDWRITRQGQEPADFWSQSFCWGEAELSDVAGPVQVRFHNNGGKRYRRAEMHLLYRVAQQDATRVTFHWQDKRGRHTESHDLPAGLPSDAPPKPWQLATGKNVKTLWVEYQPIGFTDEQGAAPSKPEVSAKDSAETTETAAPQSEPADLEPFFTPPPEFANDYGAYRSPLKFADGREVKTPEDWQARRTEILQRWHAVMGAWPPLIEKPKVTFHEQTRLDRHTRYTVDVEVAPQGGTVKGYLLIPHGDGPFPAVVVPYYDAETGAGMGKELRDFGYQLANRGYVALSIGTPDCRYWPSEEAAELQPLSMLAYVAANCHTALSQLEYVDAERIGIVGHSYGGKWAMFASCLYDKFACAAWSDGGIVFDESRGNVNYWEPWYLGYERGTRRKAGIPTNDNPRTGAYKQMVDDGLDLHELHALMAPRPLLVSGGAEDEPKRWQALNHTVAVNKLLGYTGRVAMTNRVGHSPTPESNEQIYAFFQMFLKP